MVGLTALLLDEDREERKDARQTKSTGGPCRTKTLDCSDGKFCGAFARGTKGTVVVSGTGGIETSVSGDVLFACRVVVTAEDKEWDAVQDGRGTQGCRMLGR